MTRDTKRQQSWEHAFGLMQSAWTRAEMDAAAAAMKAHLKAFPEDNERDPWHGWGSVRGGLEECEAESRRLGLSEDEHNERMEMLRRTFINVNPVDDPQALEKIACGRQELEDWLARHPDDIHALSNREQAIREEEFTRQALELLCDELQAAA